MTSEEIDSYKKIVESTSERLLNLCNEWTREIDENEKNIDDEIVQRIHSVIGKSQLLRTSKLAHFKGFLIDAEGNTIGKPVNLDDIRGFWETISIQVDQVETTFAQLKALKCNKYVESSTDGVTLKKPVKKVNTAACKKPAVSASSNLKSFIIAQRERKKLDATTDEIHIAGVVPSNGHA